MTRSKEFKEFAQFVRLEADRRGIQGVVIATEEEVMNLTAPLDEHWEGWEEACDCRLCRSYD